MCPGLDGDVVYVDVPAWTLVKVRSRRKVLRTTNKCVYL